MAETNFNSGVSRLGRHTSSTSLCESEQKRTFAERGRAAATVTGQAPAYESVRVAVEDVACTTGHYSHILSREPVRGSPGTGTVSGIL